MFAQNTNEKRIEYLTNKLNELMKNDNTKKATNVYRELLVLKCKKEINEDATYQDVLYNNGIEDCIKIILEGVL